MICSRFSALISAAAELIGGCLPRGNLCDVKLNPKASQRVFEKYRRGAEAQDVPRRHRRHGDAVGLTSGYVGRYVDLLQVNNDAFRGSVGSSKRFVPIVKATAYLRQTLPLRHAQTGIFDQEDNALDVRVRGNASQGIGDVFQTEG